MVIGSHESGHTVTSTRHPFTARHRWPRQSMVLAALALALCAGGCAEHRLARAVGFGGAAAKGRRRRPRRNGGRKRKSSRAITAKSRTMRPSRSPLRRRCAAADSATRPSRCCSRPRFTTRPTPRCWAPTAAPCRTSATWSRRFRSSTAPTRPDQPDWRILSAQGAVLDQLGRHDEAQRYYASALKIKPDDPGVLSNLGLSYALAKDLKKAEETLRRAASLGGNDPRVRQNLALVVGLEGRLRRSREHRPRRSAGRGGRRQRRDAAPDARPAERFQGHPAAAEARRRRRHLTSVSRRAGRADRPSTGADHLNCWMILMTAGPRMTMNSTGRKNRIIGTVSCGGSAAAFFSAAVMR